MPNKEPNPNRIRRQKKPDSPPPPYHGERMSPDEDSDAIEIGHKEAEAQRRTGDAVPATHGTGAGGRQAEEAASRRLTPRAALTGRGLRAIR